MRPVITTFYEEKYLAFYLTFKPYSENRKGTEKTKEIAFYGTIRRVFKNPGKFTNCQWKLLGGSTAKKVTEYTTFAISYSLILSRIQGTKKNKDIS